MIEITRKQAGSYLINRVRFDSTRSVHEVINCLSCLQVDPINVVARSHELILYNRIKDFNKEDLYTELYTKHELFEYWMQLYSIIPTSTFPYLNSTLQMQLNKNNSHWHKTYRNTHQKELEALLKHIKEHGPTSSRDIKHLPKGSAVHSWKGESSQTALLEFLWNTCEIQITHREANTKYYDLTERVIQNKILTTEVDADKAFKFLLESYFKYYGIIRTNWLSRSGRDRAEGIQKEFARQLKSSEIVQIAIGESKVKYFVKQSEVENILNSQLTSDVGVRILSPLDPLVLDRQMLLDVFGMFYRWEAYTPPAKRNFGFYNMPILFEDRFIGQIDLAKNKNTGMKKLEVRGLFLDEKSKRISNLVEEEVGRLEKFAYS